jgi:signal transduction histidine kinase
MFKVSNWNKTNFFFYCLFFMACGSVWATDIAPVNPDETSYQISFCQTNSPIINIEQAIECDYSSPYHPLALGFGEASRWVRIKIHNASDNNQLFAIQVRPYFLREINFFRYANGGWLVEKAGSHIIDNQSHDDIGGHFFITAASSQNQHTYYLQVQASSIAPISVSVTPWPNSTLRPSEHLLGIGTQIGILVTILVFSLVSLCLNPTVVLARFNLYIANLILCLLSGSGILALYVFKQMPILNALIFFNGLCLKLGLWVWLAQAFLREYNTPNWYRTSCWIIYGLVCASILIGSNGQIGIAIFLILIGYTATAMTQICAIIKTPAIGRLLQTALIVGFAVFIALIYLAIASVFFPLENNSQVPMYLSRLTDFVNPLVMLSIIVFQHRLLRKEYAQIKSTLKEIQLKSEFESKLLKDRQTLVDMFAHELKNPLTSIGLAVRTLSQFKDTTNTGDQRLLKNINEAISSMDNIIERCSLMNLIDQKAMPLHPTEINLSSFISNLLKRVNCQSQSDLQFSDQINIRTDPNLFQIILVNLIENGFKYSPDGTRLKISARETMDNESPYIRIMVTNTVHHELAPDPQLLFERFYRHPLAHETRGSGLGLSICKELCSTLGGTIKYQSFSNEATFIIELPK